MCRDVFFLLYLETTSNRISPEWILSIWSHKNILKIQFQKFLEEFIYLTKHFERIFGGKSLFCLFRIQKYSFRLSWMILTLEPRIILKIYQVPSRSNFAHKYLQIPQNLYFEILFFLQALEILIYFMSNTKNSFLKFSKVANLP